MSMGRMGQIPTVLVVGTALAIGLHTAWMAYASLTPAPFADFYPVLFQFAEHGFRWSDLLAPHNEHVIALPKLFYLADLHLASGTGVLLVTMNLVLGAGVPLAFWRIARREFFARPSDALLYGCVAAAAYFNGTHLISLSWGFMIQHWIAALSVVVAANCFARLAVGEDRFAPALYGLGTAAAASAVLSVGSGLVCLMAMAAVGVVFRLKWQPVLAFGLLALAGLVFQFLVNPPSADQTLGNLVREPLAAARFYLAYLGGPFLRCVTWPAPEPFWEFHPLRAIVLGAVLLAAGCALLAREVFRRRSTSVFAVFHSVLIVYALASGVLLTAARLHVTPYYGTEPKYAPVSLLAWIAIGSLGLAWAAARWSLPLAWRGAAWAGVLAALLVLVVPAHFREQRLAWDWKQLVWESEAGQVAGVFDPLTLNAFEHHRQQAFQLTQTYLKPRRLSMFRRYAFEMGDRLADHFALAPEGVCLGSFDQYQPLQPGAGGVSVNGWAWDMARKAKVRDVLLVDPGGRIVGLAHSTRDRPDVRGVYPQIALRCGWFGYVRQASPGTLISAYALTGSGEACLIGRAHMP